MTNHLLGNPSRYIIGLGDVRLAIKDKEAVSA